MAGPRAPIGTLSQHVTNAAGLVRSMVPGVFSKRPRKRDEPSAAESDSDSDSSSDGDNSDHSGGSGTESSKTWADKLKKKKTTTSPQVKAAAAKVIPPSVAGHRAKVESSVTKPEPMDISASESSASGSDSDEEEAEAAIISKSDSDSNSESESSDEETAAPAAKSKPTDKEIKKALSAPASASSTSESEGESSDEESASSSSEPKATGKRVATEQASASEEESNSDSEDESEEEQVVQKAKPTIKNPKAAKATPRPKEAAASKPTKSSVPAKGGARSKEMVSESDSSSAASDAESADNGESDDDAEPMEVETPKEKAKVHGPQEIISQGFYLRKAEEDLDAAAVARAFQKAKAEGKQIWYFTTPKSVPIEVIQKHAIPLDKVHAGKSIFSHEGGEYTGAFEETVNHAIKVLVPGKGGNRYETANQTVDRVFHVTRVTRFGEDDEGQPSLPATSATVTSKAPRPQPKGLRARYHPFGVTSGSVGNAGADESDSDQYVKMVRAPPLTKAATPKKAAKKRKHGDVEKGTPDLEEVAATPAKKSKKARTDKAAKQAAPDPPQTDTTSAVKKSKSKDKTKKDSASTGTKKPKKITPVPPPAIPTSKST
ncbi:hypothetical protein BT67DRAFT_436281 [Trichocladium antarcticum]|uniref:Uncharacterized protein n=1 Tax=Trichocladium antarcticum TaxID=1450529 RepID=A0AAN6UEQ5_9PEZI|nr:hypothetical protein BT67DRAFT_436281 [Trichocladium antarcticum]